MFCTPTEHYYCSVTGGKVCLDITSNAKNNCNEELPINFSVALAIGATAVAAIYLALALTLLKIVIVLKRKIKENNKIPNSTSKYNAKFREALNSAAMKKGKEKKLREKKNLC